MRGQPAEQELTEQRPDLITGELPVTARRAGIRDGNGQPATVAVVGDDEVGGRSPGQRDRQVERARFQGIREPGDGRKIGIGRELSLYHVRCRVAGLLERAQR